MDNTDAESENGSLVVTRTTSSSLFPSPPNVLIETLANPIRHADVVAARKGEPVVVARCRPRSACSTRP